MESEVISTVVSQSHGDNHGKATNGVCKQSSHPRHVWSFHTKQLVWAPSEGWLYCLWCSESILSSSPGHTTIQIWLQAKAKATFMPRWTKDGGRVGQVDFISSTVLKGHTATAIPDAKSRTEPTSEHSTGCSLVLNLEHEKEGRVARWQGDPARSELMKQGPQNKRSTKWTVLNRVHFVDCFVFLSIQKKKKTLSWTLFFLTSCFLKVTSKWEDSSTIPNIRHFANYMSLI